MTNVNSGPGQAYLNRIQYAGMRMLGRAWLGYHLGPAWPGVVPHKRGTGLEGALLGFGKRYFEQVLQGPKTASDFFHEIGVHDLAAQNHGACSVSIGTANLIYLCSTKARLAFMREGHLVLSEAYDGPTLASRVLVTRTTADQSYQADRQWLERKLATVLFTHNNLNTIAGNLDRVLPTLVDQPRDLVDFLLHVLLESSSRTRGLLDLFQVSLREIVSRSEQSWSDFRHTLTVIDYLGEGKYHPKDAAKRLRAAFESTFVTTVRENFESILEAGPDTAVQVWFKKHTGRTFPETRAELETFIASDPKADGQRILETMAVDFGMVFTTGLIVNTVGGLSWVVCEIERNPSVKQALLQELSKLEPGALSQKAEVLRSLGLLQDIILESLRLNPPVGIIGGVVRQPYDVEFNGATIHLPRGTVLVADLRECNVDPTLVPNPHQFDVQNIRSLRAREGRPLASFIHNEDVLASFGGGGRKSPDKDGGSEPTRRCPGASYSVVLQSLVLAKLYSEYDVELGPTRPKDRPHGMTTRPHPVATITTRKRRPASP